MGLFSQIGDSLAELGKGDLKGMVNAFGSGGSASTSNYQKAYDEVFNAWVLKRKAELKKSGLSNAKATQQAITEGLAYMATDAGKMAVTKIEGQLNAGQSAQGLTVKGILTDVANSVITGVTSGLTTAVSTTTTNAVNQGAQALGVTSAAQSVQESIGQFFGGVADEATKTWLAKNWYWLVIPVLPILYFLFRGGSLFGRKTSKGGKTATFRK